MKLRVIKKEIHGKKVIIRYFIIKNEELKIDIKFIKNDFFNKYSSREYCFFNDLLFLEVKMHKEGLNYFKSNKKGFKRQLFFLHNNEIVYEIPNILRFNINTKEYFLKINKT